MFVEHQTEKIMTVGSLVETLQMKCDEDKNIAFLEL